MTQKGCTPIAGIPIVDADAHVIETEQTWDYLEGSDRRFRPVLFGSREMSKQYWVLEHQVQELSQEARPPACHAERIAGDVRRGASSQTSG